MAQAPRSIACALLALGLSSSALAQELPAPGRITGHVSVAEGIDAADVVVYVVGYSEPPPESETAVVHQRGMEFSPALLPITAGQEVSFPNEDTILHNVYSPAPRLDLGTYPPGETRVQRLSKPGVVDFYCNIHPTMAVTVLVLPNRRFTRAASDGSYAIEGVRAGTWTVYAYHRRAPKPARREVEVVEGGSTDVDLAIPSFEEATPSGE